MDDADRATDLIEAQLERNIAAARGAPLPSGMAGDCDLCGEWSGRLIEGLCASCREYVERRQRRLERVR